MTGHAQRQIECHDAMRRDHQLVALVRSLDEALETVRGWGFLAHQAFIR